MRKVKYYKCPECGKKFKTLSGWSGHMDMMHPSARPEGFSDSRFFYYILTGKTAGSCIECHSPTDWSEATGKYNRYCNNPACKKAYVKLAKSRMTNKYGKEYLLDDPDMQRKMVSSRKISGYYTFSDGSGKLGYVGSYEKDFLMMMDKFMRYSANDILSPSPNTYFYEYEGKKHFYIPDFYVPNLNLEIEIKASDNTHPKIQAVDKVKERLKDEVMQNNPKINYIKINDKVYTGFFDYLLSLKESVDDADVKGNVSNTAELSPSTEALDYIDDDKNDAEGEYDPSIYFYPEINLSPATEAVEDTNTGKRKKPIIFIFEASNIQNGFINYDQYEKFKVYNPFEPTTQYEIVPDTSGTVTKNGVGSYVTLSNFPDENDNTFECLAFSYFVDDTVHERFFEKLRKCDSVHNPLSYAWDSSVRRWLGHSDKFRFFCYSFVQFVLMHGVDAATTPVPVDLFNPTKIVLVDCGKASDIRIDDLITHIEEWNDAYRDLVHEKPLIEEAVLEDKFYTRMPPALEELFYNNSFTEGTSMNDEATESLQSYVSHKNWEFNMDKWKPVAGNNVLYVTGYSGSGKTTYAKSIAKNTPNAVYVDMDILVMHTEDKIKYGSDNDSSRLAKQFFKDHKGIIVDDMNGDDAARVKYAMDWIEKYAYSHPSTLFIVDGIWLMYFCAPEYFRSRPIIVMGTSIAKSVKRRSLRDGDPDKSSRNRFYYSKEDEIRKNFIDELSSYTSGRANESTEVISPAEESYIFSGKDYEQNLDKWKPGEFNTLFITGHSGSGKSTLAEKLEKEKHAIMFELDGLDHNYDSSNKGILDKLKARNPTYKYAVENKWPPSEKDDLIIAKEKIHLLSTVAKDLVMLCREDKEHLYIIEGIQIFQWLNPGYFKNKPLIIKGTSMIQSYLRAAKREGGIKNLDGFNNWTRDEKMIQDFGKHAKESIEMISPVEESIQLHTNFDKVKVKGTLSLSKFTKIRITQDLLEKYKEKCASFGHCRVSNMSKGYLYVDKKDNIVGFVNVVKKPDGIKWIQALNIQPEYQGYGLYEQLLKVAVRELGGTDISAPPKNDTAKELYRKFGFRTYTDEESVHAMSIRADAQRVKYDAKAKPNATNMTEAGLYPVFVMLTHSKKGFGRVVKFMTHAPYSHASISFDSSMDRLYSFASRDGHTMIPLGMATESLDQYKKATKDAIFTLYVKLVDKEDKDLMERKVKEMYNRRTEFRYDIPGVVKNFFGQRSANEKRYFCSGFVAYILNSGKRQATDKPSDMMRPMDIPDIQYIHLVDMGLVRDYDKNYVDKKVDQIFKKHYMNKEKDSHKQPIDEDKKGEK